MSDEERMNYEMAIKAKDATIADLRRMIDMRGDLIQDMLTDGPKKVPVYVQVGEVDAP